MDTNLLFIIMSQSRKFKICSVYHNTQSTQYSVLYCTVLCRTEKDRSNGMVLQYLIQSMPPEKSTLQSHQ